MIETLVVVGMGLLGVLGWRRLAPRLQRLRMEDSTAFGGWLAIAAFVTQSLVTMAMLRSVDEALPLERLMTLQALAALLGAGVALALLARRDGSVRRLGLRAQRGPPAVLVALAAWLAFYPVLVGVALVNRGMLAAFGVEDGLQEPLQLFLVDSDARRSVLAWSAIVLVIPMCEELVFRGALYGALRRTLHPALAIGLSALLFGMVHESTALLPAAALGAMLAWLYERTGSLSAPIAFHALHNGITLLTAYFFPEMLT